MVVSEDRVRRARARFTEISREQEERRGMRERDLAEMRADSETRRERAAEIAQAELKEVSRSVDNDGAGGAWWRRSESQDGNNRFGFEEDEEFRDQGSEYPSLRRRAEPTLRKSSVPDEDEDDFATVDWTSE